MRIALGSGLIVLSALVGVHRHCAMSQPGTVDRAPATPPSDAPATGAQGPSASPRAQGSQRAPASPRASASAATAPAFSSARAQPAGVGSAPAVPAPTPVAERYSSSPAARPSFSAPTAQSERPVVSAAQPAAADAAPPTAAPDAAAPDAAAPQAAAAQAAAPAEAPVAPKRAMALLTLSLNGVEHDVIDVLLDGDEVLVRIADLERAGLRLDLDEAPDGAPGEAPGGGRVALGSLSDQLRYTLDERELRLDVVADPERLPTNRVSLRRDRRPAEIEYRSDLSAFVNYGLRLHDFGTFDGYGEAGVSLGSARMYTGVTVPPGSAPVRGLSNLTVDDRPRLRRLIVGDAVATGGVLGGGATIGGIQLARSLELDPYFTPGSSLDQAATVMAPSTVEVYVNDQLVHTQEVAPGPLQLQDIPANAGAGDTRVVLRDALGREQSLTASHYRPTGLLERGQQVYSYTLGMQREGLGSESWSYGKPGLLGVHRYGMTPMLTLGSRVEAATDRVSGGLSAGAGVGFGQLELAVGGSAAEDVAQGGAPLPGAAASLSWSWSGHRAGASIWGRGLTEGYSTLGLDAADDRALGDVGASVSVPLGSDLTMTGSYGVAAMRDSGVRQRASLNSGVQLPADLHLSLMTAWTRDDTGPDQISGYLSLSRTFGRRTTATVGAEASLDAQDGRAELQRSLPAHKGLGYRVGARAGDNDHAFGRVEGRARVGLAQASADWRPGQTSNMLGVAGGVVAIGGRVFATNPVDQGYALVRVPDVAGVRAYLNNNEVGRTDRRGDLVVTGLEPYYGNRLSISDLDVPLDHAIASTERVIAPAPRSGALVAFPVRRARLVRGRVDVLGVDAAYGELQVISEERTFVSPVGKGGEFELEDLLEGSWPAKLRFRGGACSLVVDVPADDRAIVDVGVLYCDSPLAMATTR